MKKIIYLLVIISVVTGCTSNSSNTHSLKVNKSDSIISTKTTPLTDKKDKQVLDKKGMQLYEYKNDTLIQRVYTKQLSTKKIQFVLETINSKTGRTCDFSDTAKVLYSGDPAMYYDEKDEDEPYGAKEYIYNKKGNYIAIGIDIQNKNRLLVEVADKSITNFNGCNYKSLATLRKK